MPRRDSPDRPRARRGAVPTLPLAPAAARTAQPRVVVVLGMHRSGTSLLSNLLQLLGVDMVEAPGKGSPANPLGHWERQDLLQLHERILAEIGCPVESPLHSTLLPAGWWRRPAVQALKRELVQVVGAHLASTPGPWGFKDPRTCRLLPLWGEVFDALGVQPAFVWAIRHPAESSVSMALKNPRARPMTPALAELMWLAYNHDILRHVGPLAPLVVRYDDWFADPRATAGRLLAQLGLAWRGTEQELRDCLRETVQAEFRHQRQPAAADDDSLAAPLYRAIERMADGRTVDAAALARLAEDSDRLLRAVRPMAELAAGLPALRAELQAQAAELAALQQAAAPARKKRKGARPRGD